jgi:threonine/homoserine/homoserine lactone efflux protein
MIPAANAWAFALVALALIVIPGPSVLFVVGRSLSLGRRGGFLSVVGNALGMLPAIALVSMGVGAIVAESVVIFTVIKFAGAVYLIYLGVQAIRHRGDHLEAAGANGTAPTAARLIREGFVVGATNPKTLVFFVAVLPQFVSRESGYISVQMALLGLIFFAISLISDSVWAFTAGSLRAWFARDPRRVARMGAGGGVMMIGLGGVLAVAGNKS